MANYSSKEVNVIVDGTYLTGIMDGTFVQTARTSDKFSMHTGAKGETTFVENADDTGTVTVTLKHNSSSVSFLMKKAETHDPFSVQVVDSNDAGKFKAGGSECLIQRKPDSERGAEVSGLEFTFLVADFDQKAE